MIKNIVFEKKYGKLSSIAGRTIYIGYFIYFLFDYSIIGTGFINTHTFPTFTNIYKIFDSKLILETVIGAFILYDFLYTKSESLESLSNEPLFIEKTFIWLFEKQYKRKMKKKYKSVYLLQKLVGLYDYDFLGFPVHPDKENSIFTTYPKLREFTNKTYFDENYMKTVDLAIFKYNFLLIKILEIKEQLANGTIQKDNSMSLQIKVNESLKIIVEELEQVEQIMVHKNLAMESINKDYTKLLENDLNQEMQLLNEIKELHNRRSVNKQQARL